MLQSRVLAFLQWKKQLAETSYFHLMYPVKWSLNLIKWFSQKCGFKADLDARIYEVSRIWLYSVVQMC